MTEKELLQARLKLMADILHENHLMVDKKKLMSEMQKLAFKLKEME
jgi:hypothetical protein